MRFAGGGCAVFKQVPLKIKFSVLFITVMAILMAANIVWRSYTLERQVEHEMLETTQVLAQEMDAIWDFMESNENQFVENDDGTRNLYCVVAAKAVSHLFTVNNERDFAIHYTNLSTRKPADAPDGFEAKALETLKADPELDHYYSLETEEDGTKVFRYIEPLYITESCLECHGDPAGELDIMGYEKEGMKEGDMAGAASILMPADTYMDNVRESLIQETIVFVLFVFVGLGITFFSISKLVTSPLKKLEDAAQQIEEHDFDVSLTKIGDRDEIEHLSAHFHSMAEQLKRLYSDLEGEVQDRTTQLAESNRVLERQREELAAMNEKLEQENRYQSDFLAIMSHEIRTPLTSILAFADIWSRTNDPRNPEEESIMKEMRVNSQILLAMVNNILEMARVEAGRSELALEPSEIPDLLTEIKGTMRFLADKKQVKITSRIDRDMPVVMIDSEKVRRILENLVSNAIKFVDEQGSVDIDARYLWDTEELVLTVSDDGCGIKPEDVPYIFERFVQGKDGSKHKHGGSGLGLTVVRELAELHGGSVELTQPRETEDGDARGCAFVVRLKAEPGQSGDLE
ncbi:histidine kinase [Eggerthella sinensis]|uniref:histidine kinase n=1 Tax=Eggerthella sinensis TaxID=242230 RepID=A0A3N0IX34_9ACTN|nr:histidine kinase [Eggerthella sinensis]RNM41487.1 histidine kinase [Eggerthella sinensis]